MTVSQEISQLIEHLDLEDRQLVSGYITQLGQWLNLTGPRGILALGYVGAKIAEEAAQRGDNTQIIH